MATIVIDAGHGGADPGAVFEGRQEKDDTLRLALAVGKILEENGQNVIYTRTTDVYQTPFQKATIGNEARADFFVSIHRNSSPVAGQYSGVETLVYERSGIKEEMAENINRELEETGFENLGVKERPGLVVLRRTKMPAVLVEAGFINNGEDNRIFDENFEKVAQAIVCFLRKLFLHGRKRLFQRTFFGQPHLHCSRCFGCIRRCFRCLIQKPDCHCCLVLCKIECSYHAFLRGLTTEKQQAPAHQQKRAD